MRVWCLLVALPLVSCRLVHANREFNVMSETVARISGTVLAANGARSEPVIVAAVQETEGGPRVLNYEVLISAGLYNLLLPPGKFRVIAFEDLNHDFVLQDGELSGELKNGVQVA